MAVYLNNAASGFPRAPGVVEAVRQSLLEPLRSHGRGTGSGADLQEECRALLAQLLDVPDPSRIVLTVSATQGLNLALLGLDLPRGARVVTSVMEHNSVNRPLTRLERERGVVVERAGLDGAGQLDGADFLRKLGGGAALAILVHASNVTGLVNGVAPLFAAAKDAGAVTLLDASQAVGILPVHPRELNADLVAFTGHKGFHGPPGTGALYVAPEVELTQVFTGGTGVHGDQIAHPPEMPMRLEAGTPNVPAYAGLAAALRWVHSRGAGFEQHARQLGRRLREGLAGIPGVQVFGAPSPALATGAVSFRVAGMSVGEAAQALSADYGIECRSGLHCAPLIHAPLGSAPEGTLRLSVSGFNTEAEVEFALDAVRKLAGA
jgi:selenocysteine lyase/cysteine desulfurase